MRNVSQPASNTIPAAQYLRMSNESQQYSMDNQKAAIQEYAACHGFTIIKTYADAGKSGVIAKHRAALRELLKDVLSGNAEYKAILVYDVSRWGRYPNNDEAAHYEFLCSSSGIPLHYCAEPFANDGTASSSILKALKRSMAAEFSRELGDKVYRGKSRIAQLGFWVGGPPGYGYRRLMVSADGKPKQLLSHGECKSLTTDRIILVPGPHHEVECVRHIFSMVLDGLTRTEIARQLNERGVTRNGKRWEPLDVYNIVTNPKYTGCNVWHRRSTRLRGKRIPVEPAQWITKPAAFEALVGQATFDRAQATLPRRADSLWSDEEMLRRLRRLLAKKGRLSETLIRSAKGMPSATTLHTHFGTYRDIYKAIGYYLPAEDVFGNERAEPSMRLRRQLVNRIRSIFPENITVTHLPHRSRSILQIDHTFMVSVLLCRIRKVAGRPRWIMEPNPAEREYITLLCKIAANDKRISSYYLMPRMEIAGKTHSTYKIDPWLCTGIRLRHLSEFYGAVTRLWDERQNPFAPRL